MYENEQDGVSVCRSDEWFLLPEWGAIFSFVIIYLFYNFSVPMSNRLSIHGSHFNIKTIFPGMGLSYHKDKMFVKLSYFYGGNHFTGKMASLYWDGPPGSLNNEIFKSKTQVKVNPFHLEFLTRNTKICLHFFFILHGRCRGSWCTGDARSQGISSHGSDPFFCCNIVVSLPKWITSEIWCNSRTWYGLIL